MDFSSTQLWLVCASGSFDNVEGYISDTAILQPSQTNQAMSAPTTALTAAEQALAGLPALRHLKLTSSSNNNGNSNSGAGGVDNHHGTASAQRAPPEVVESNALPSHTPPRRVVRHTSTWLAADGALGVANVMSRAEPNPISKAPELSPQAVQSALAGPTSLHSRLVAAASGCGYRVLCAVCSPGAVL